MRRAHLLAAFLCLGAATRTHAQDTAQASSAVRIIAPGEARSASALRQALAGPHVVHVGDPAHEYTLPPTGIVSGSLLVIGGPAVIEGIVRGDVVVVGGDLFVHPGASVGGRIVAIGGGAYPSMLATIGGGTLRFPDESYDVSREAAGLTLRFRALPRGPAASALSLTDGARTPVYDRVDGLSLGWGPVIRPSSVLEVAPAVIYRSNLGRVDPVVGVRWGIDARDTVRLHFARETATNEMWIRSDLFNSALALWSGDDEHNYFRRDAASGEISRAWAHAGLEVSASVGARVERDWSVGGDSGALPTPWSVLRRFDVEEGMARPNPAVHDGTLSSGAVGVALRWILEDVTTIATLRAEVPWSTPDGERFAQFTTDLAVAFPTFGEQRLTTTLHALVTAFGRAPPQRFSYVGGAGTVGTVDPTLAFGGDELVFVQTSYDVPISRYDVPFFGHPVVSLLYIAGGAGIQTLPALTQNVGGKLAVGPLRFYALVDPTSHRHILSAGLSIIR